MPRPLSQPFAQFVSPEGLELLEAVSDRHLRHQIRGFLGFLGLAGGSLADVSDEDVASFETKVRALGLNRPSQIVRGAALAWNKLSGCVPSWPSVQLTVPDNRGWVTIAWEDLPQSLRTDIEAYLHSAKGDDIFSDQVELSDKTIRDRRAKIRQLVSHGVECGIPLFAFKRLADLFEDGRPERILRHLWERVGKAPNNHASNLARTLKLIGKHWVKAPSAVIDQVARAEARMREVRSGMTPKNRARLRQLIEPANLKRLVGLPGEIVRSVDGQPPSVTRALKIQSALAIALLLNCPMRMENLAGLLLDAHIDRIGPNTIHVVIDQGEVKNKKDLSYVLSPSVVALFDLYVTVYRPLLISGSNSPALFISREGRQKTPAELGNQITKLIRDTLALDVNPHLFRHLAGYLYLSVHPGQYEPVRQLLGHKDIQTTIDFYCGLETDETLRRYDQILESLRTKEAVDV